MERDEPLVEIQTDKVNAEVPSPVAGFLQQILLPEGTTAAVKTDMAVIGDEYQHFCEDVDAGLDTLLDPYGAQSIDEFFAVATEVFFVAPTDMAAEHPRLYRLLAGYYLQDPATESHAP